MTRHFSTNAVGVLFGVEAWRIGKVFTSGLVPEPPRVGRIRLIRESDLPKIRAALVKLGFIQADTPAGSTITTTA